MHTPYTTLGYPDHSVYANETIGARIVVRVIMEIIVVLSYFHHLHRLIPALWRKGLGQYTTTHGIEWTENMLLSCYSAAVSAILVCRAISVWGEIPPENVVAFDFVESLFFVVAVICIWMHNIVLLCGFATIGPYVITIYEMLVGDVVRVVRAVRFASSYY